MISIKNYKKINSKLKYSNIYWGSNIPDILIDISNTTQMCYPFIDHDEYLRAFWAVQSYGIWTFQAIGKNKIGGYVELFHFFKK